MIAIEGEDKTFIENLVKSYVQRPGCIVLVAVACVSEYSRSCLSSLLSSNLHTVDWQNQQGYDLAKRYDPDGKRIIGELSGTYSPQVTSINLKPQAS